MKHTTDILNVCDSSNGGAAGPYYAHAIKSHTERAPRGAARENK